MRQSAYDLTTEETEKRNGIREAPNSLATPEGANQENFKVVIERFSKREKFGCSILNRGQTLQPKMTYVISKESQSRIWDVEYICGSLNSRIKFWRNQDHRSDSEIVR